MLPIQPIKNLAPIKPLFDLADKSNRPPTYIESGLKELFADILKRDEQTFREIAETTEVTSNFCQGKQLWQQTTSGWRIRPNNKVDPNKITAINQMQYYLTQNIDRVTASNPDLEPSEEFRQIQYKEKIKKSAAVWNGYEKKWYKAWFNHQEALHMILSGTYIESVQYDHLAAGAKVFQEIWGEREVPIVEGEGICFECDTKASDADFLPEDSMPACPNCGSSDIDIKPSVSQIVPAVTGLQPIQTGDLILKLIPLQSARFDVRKRAEESTHFLERIKISTAKLEMLLGVNLNLKEANITEDKGLQSLDNIQRAGNTLYGRDDSRTYQQINQKECILDRLSLSAEEYYHIRASVDEQTVSGENIEAGQKLVDLAPNGMTIIGVNGFQKILGIYPGIHHSQEITSGVYHMRLESGVGRGSEDEVVVQKRFNRNDAQMLKAGETGATPAYSHVEGSVKREFIKQIGFPGVSIPVKREIAEALGTPELIRQLPPASIAGTFFQYTYDLLNRYWQMAAHAPDLSNSLFDQKSGGTATEARISDSNAERLSSPMTEIKAEVRCGTADKTLKAYNRHFQGVSKYFSYGSTAQNVGVGEQIKGEDIDCDIEFVVVKDSHRPKTRYSQQQGMAAVMQMTGGAAGIVQLKEAAPDLLDDLLKTFDVDLNTNDYDEVEDLCWSRLNQAIQTAGQDPMVTLMSLKPLITPFELEHEEKAVWLAKYLSCPEGAKLDEVKRATIFTLIMAHRNGGVYQMGDIIAAQNEAQAIGSQPIVEQQRQEAELQSGRETEAKQLEADNQAAAKERELGFQSQENEANRELQREQGASGEALQREQMVNSAQLEREKMANATTS